MQGSELWVRILLIQPLFSSSSVSFSTEEHMDSITYLTVYQVLTPQMSSQPHENVDESSTLSRWRGNLWWQRLMHSEILDTVHSALPSGTHETDEEEKRGWKKIIFTNPSVHNDMIVCMLMCTVLYVSMSVCMYIHDDMYI